MLEHLRSQRWRRMGGNHTCLSDSAPGNTYSSGKSSQYPRNNGLLIDGFGARVSAPTAGSSRTLAGESGSRVHPRKQEAGLSQDVVCESPGSHLQSRSPSAAQAIGAYQGRPGLDNTESLEYQRFRVSGALRRRRRGGSGRRARFSVGKTPAAT